MVRVGMARVLCAGFFFVVASVQGAAFSFFDLIQGEIANEIAFFSDTNNAVPRAAAQIRSLTQAQNLIDYRGRVSMNRDIQVLSLVSALLSRPAFGTNFTASLGGAVSNYLAMVQEEVLTLGTNIAALPASNQTRAALDELDAIQSLLDRAEATSSPVLASRLLVRAVARLNHLQDLVELLTQKVFTPQFTASVGDHVFQADVVPTARYNPAVAFLSLNAIQTTGTASETISLTINSVQPGTTTHQFGDATSSTYAIYTRHGTNTLGFISTSGSAIVTIDLQNRTASGTFNFMGVSRTGLDAPVQVSGGTFSVPLR